MLNDQCHWWSWNCYPSRSHEFIPGFQFSMLIFFFLQIPSLRKGEFYFVKQHHSDSTKMFLIDNIFVIFDGCILQQNNSALLALIRRRQTSYKGFSRKTKKKLVRGVNITFHYIDDVFSLNNSRICDFVDCIYPTGI